MVFEDDNLMVIDKPAGLVVTSEGESRGETLEQWLVKRQGNLGLPRAGIVHRLDKGTSGLIVAAKTSAAFCRLQKDFKERQVSKEYLALVCGLTVADGQIQMPIGRKRFGVWGRFGVTISGKMAVTKFKREGIYGKDDLFFSLLRVKIETGRTHQIRVHLSYLGWPVVGDGVYGKGGGKRIFLHATKLGLVHPVTGERLEWELPPGNDWIEEGKDYEKVEA